MRRIVLASLFLSASVLSGCDIFAPHPEGDTKDKCAWMKEDSGDRPADEGRVAIIVDVSNSTRSGAPGAEAPSYPAALADVIKDAVSRKARVSVASFGGSVTGLDRTGFKTRSTKNNTTNQERQENAARECLTEAVSSAAQKEPTDAGTDVLAAVRSAADWIREGNGPKHIVLATDGLPTTGCADLTNAAFGGDKEVASIVKICEERKEIRPKDLVNVRFTMLGVGRAAPEHPVASAEQLEWLRRLWEGLCRAAGGSACEINTAAVAAGDAPAVAVPKVADPVVGFDKVWNIMLPSAALFETNKWDLRQEALASLELVAVNVRTIPRAKVEVGGHADARGNAKDNLELSQRRAESVMRFLASRGVRDLMAKGYGETRPLCTDPVPDDGCLQRNRRVEITVYQV